MKKTLKAICTGLVTVLALTAVLSCNNASELPPLNEGYATRFIMPDPVDLTAEDREYLYELETEYEQATSGASGRTSPAK